MIQRVQERRPLTFPFVYCYPEDIPTWIKVRQTLNPGDTVCGTLDKIGAREGLAINVHQAMWTEKSAQFKLDEWYEFKTGFKLRQSNLHAYRLAWVASIIQRLTVQKHEKEIADADGLATRFGNEFMCDHHEMVERTKVDYICGKLVQITEMVEVETFHDVDNHTLQCRLCGKLEYYSYAARQYYEHGVDHPLINMDTLPINRS